MKNVFIKISASSLSAAHWSFNLLITWGQNTRGFHQNNHAKWMVTPVPRAPREYELFFRCYSLDAYLHFIWAPTTLSAYFTGLAFLLRYGWWIFRERLRFYSIFGTIRHQSRSNRRGLVYIPVPFPHVDCETSKIRGFIANPSLKTSALESVSLSRWVPVRAHRPSLHTYFTTIAENEAARSKISISAKIWHFIWAPAEMPRWDVKM